jgi:hypothetical protein
MVEIVSKADAPHLYQAVSSDFAARFLPPVHMGQEEVKSGGLFSLSMVNMNEEYYACPDMNNKLGSFSEHENIAVDEDGDFRMYMINKFNELDESAVASLGSLIDKGAVKVFEQKIIFSSVLVKAGVNYYALYNTDDGPRLVMTSVLMGTPYIDRFTKLYMNGFAAGSIKGPVVNVARLGAGDFTLVEGFAAASQGSISFVSPDTDCKSGLGQGVVKYAYNLAKRIAN